LKANWKGQTPCTKKPLPANKLGDMGQNAPLFPKYTTNRTFNHAGVNGD